MQSRTKLILLSAVALVSQVGPVMAETPASLAAAIADLQRRLSRMESDQRRQLQEARASERAAMKREAAAQPVATAPPAAAAAVTPPGPEKAPGDNTLSPAQSAAAQKNTGADSVIGGLANPNTIFADLKGGDPVRIYETSGTSVHLFALVEATLSYASPIDRSGRSRVGFQTAWFSGNRWGINASQVLDPASGLSIIANLESEFELPTGNMDTSGVLFNRDAWVGFSSPGLGKLTFGRQNTLPRDVSNIYSDPYSAAPLSTAEGGFSNVNNFKQIIFYSGGGSGAGGQGDTRLDNGIVYKKILENGIFLGAAYAFSDGNGPGGPNGSGAIPGAGIGKGSVQSVALGYNGSSFHVSAFYNHTDVLEVGYEGETNHGHDHQSVGVGGNYTIGPVRVDTGYFFYTADQGRVGRRTDHVVTVSGKYAPNIRWDYELGWEDFFANNAALTSAGYTFVPYHDATGATKAGTGTRMATYGSIIHHPARNVDVYLAGDYLKTTGGYVASQIAGHHSGYEAATGVRWKF